MEKALDLSFDRLLMMMMMMMMMMIQELGEPVGYVLLHLTISGPKLVYNCCLQLSVFLIMEMITVCYENKAEHVNALLWAEGGAHVPDCYSRC